MLASIDVGNHCYLVASDTSIYGPLYTTSYVTHPKNIGTSPLLMILLHFSFRPLRVCSMTKFFSSLLSFIPFYLLYVRSVFMAFHTSLKLCLLIFFGHICLLAYSTSTFQSFFPHVWKPPPLLTWLTLDQW